MKKKFRVGGMSCSACVSAIEKGVGKMAGVESVHVNLLTATMEVEFDGKALKLEDIKKKVVDLGYKADEEKDEEKEMKTRLIVSAIFVVPLFVISMFMGIHSLFPSERAVLWTCFLLTVPIVAINFDMYKKGFWALVKRHPNMDSLVAVGTAASLVLLYFESAGVILTLVTLGKWLEAGAKRNTTAALEGLMSLTPDKATVIRDGKEVSVPTPEVAIGDQVVARPGESIAVDGTVVKGQTTVNQGAITGESIPALVKEGDKVVGGTVNIEGHIVYEATEVGKDTIIAKIISLVEEASSGKAPISRLADKVSGIFVPVVIGLALLTLAAWAVATAVAGRVDWDHGLVCAISVLVISCPCALGLATPVAIMVGTGRGASEGIIIKSAEALEMLGKVNVMVYDKTGTITEGRPEVTDIISLSGKDENQILSLAASLEAKSEHPLGKAICEKAKEQGLKVKEAENFKYSFGKGIEGKVAGKRYFAGNEAYMEEVLGQGQDAESPTAFMELNLEELKRQGKTLILLASSKEILAVLALADKLKPTSIEAITMIGSMGIEQVMLTGDNQVTAEAISRQVGITGVHAEVLPADKERVIRELKEQGKMVAMIGDGVNDAPAIARADVGMAIGAGTDIAIESAEVIIMSGDLLAVEKAMVLSRATIANIKMSLFWAFIYNVVCIPVAAGVLYPAFGILLSPMIAAAAMSLSSLCVVLNALRLKGKRLAV